MVMSTSACPLSVRVRSSIVPIGSLQWGLFNDTDVPDRWTEMFLVESWVEHLRQHERVTVADEEVRHRVGSFHVGDRPPEVRHLVAERFPRG